MLPKAELKQLRRRPPSRLAACLRAHDADGAYECLMGDLRAISAAWLALHASVANLPVIWRVPASAAALVREASAAHAELCEHLRLAAEEVAAEADAGAEPAEAVEAAAGSAEAQMRAVESIDSILVALDRAAAML